MDHQYLFEQISSSYHKIINESRDLCQHETNHLINILHNIVEKNNYDAGNNTNALYQYRFMEAIAALLTEDTDARLKYHLMDTLTSFVKSSESAAFVWKFCYDHKVIDIIISAKSFRPSLTCVVSESIVEFILTLSKFIEAKSISQMKNYFMFVHDSIFIKLCDKKYAFYENEWKLMNKCMKLLNFIIQRCDASFCMVFKEQKTLKIILHMIFMVNETYTISYDSNYSFENEMSCFLLEALYFIEFLIKLEENVMSHQNIGIASNDPMLLPDIVRFLLSSNKNTNHLDYIHSLVAFINYCEHIPKQAAIAAKILNHIIQYQGMSIISC